MVVGRQHLVHELRQDDHAASVVELRAVAQHVPHALRVLVAVRTAREPARALGVRPVEAAVRGRVILVSRFGALMERNNGFPYYTNKLQAQHKAEKCTAVRQG